MDPSRLRLCEWGTDLKSPLWLSSSGGSGQAPTAVCCICSAARISPDPSAFNACPVCLVQVDRCLPQDCVIGSNLSHCKTISYLKQRIRTSEMSHMEKNIWVKLRGARISHLLCTKVRVVFMYALLSCPRQPKRWSACFAHDLMHFSHEDTYVSETLTLRFQSLWSFGLVSWLRGLPWHPRPRHVLAPCSQEHRPVAVVTSGL